jgi:hypothetical protein
MSSELEEQNAVANFDMGVNSENSGLGGRYVVNMVHSHVFRLIRVEFYA